MSNHANTNSYTDIQIIEWISIWFTFGWDFIIVHWKNLKRVWRNIRPTSHMDRWFWWRIWNFLLHQWVVVSANLLFKECAIGTHTHTHIVTLSNQISVMCGNYCNNWYSRLHCNIYLNGVQSNLFVLAFLRWVVILFLSFGTLLFLQAQQIPSNHFWNLKAKEARHHDTMNAKSYPTYIHPSAAQGYIPNCFLWQLHRNFCITNNR